jgi:DNA-binding IclR family transcriptional regulator
MAKPKPTQKQRRPPGRLAQLLTRVRGEFIEMPGMRLTAAQAWRLLGIKPALCQRILRALVNAQFLEHRPDGTYIRQSGLKARLRAASSVLATIRTDQP